MPIQLSSNNQTSVAIAVRLSPKRFPSVPVFVIRQQWCSCCCRWYGPCTASLIRYAPSMALFWPSCLVLLPLHLRLICFSKYASGSHLIVVKACIVFSATVQCVSKDNFTCNILRVSGGFGSSVVTVPQSRNPKAAVLSPGCVRNGVQLKWWPNFFVNSELCCLCRENTQHLCYLLGSVFFYL